MTLNGLQSNMIAIPCMNIPKTDNYWQDLLFLYTETNKAHNPPVFDLGKKL